MLNQFIEKLMGLTWIVTKTGVSAKVQINVTMRAVITQYVRRGEIELRIEHRFKKKYGDDYSWSAFLQEEDGQHVTEWIFTCWSNTQVTPTQASAIHTLSAMVAAI